MIIIYNGKTNKVIKTNKIIVKIKTLKMIYVQIRMIIFKIKIKKINKIFNNNMKVH